MSKDAIVIVSAARTPMGAFQGNFNNLTAPQLGSVAIKAAFERAGIEAAQVEELIFGNVLQAGVGQAPARQSALGAGLSKSVTCTTINKVCGSALKAVMLMHDSLLADSYEIGIAGGQESMSNAPYLLPKARGGYRLGHGQMLDHMFFDGLEDAYQKGRLMGAFAEECAESYAFTRQAQDEFAIQSTLRAQKAISEGSFKWEIAPVTLAGKKGDTLFEQDEPPMKAQIDKIPGLKAAFKKDGTVTAANSSSIADGAAALVLMKASKAKSLGLTPLARIVGHATHAHEPALFSTAPVFAIEKLLKKTGWKVEDVDLWEINEAFAVVTMAAIHDLKLDPAKVNVHGGACALGHPIGASGARILVTLLGALRKLGKHKGVASLCIGGGEAVAVSVEML
jgi:acetyl-CoA C-acetyltransferase